MTDIQKVNPAEYMQNVKIAALRHFGKRQDFIFGIDGRLIRIEDLGDGEYKIHENESNHEYTNSSDGLMRHIERLFDVKEEAANE